MDSGHSFIDEDGIYIPGIIVRESLHTLSDGKWDNGGIPTLVAVVPQLTQLRNRFPSEITLGRKALRASIVAPVLTRCSPPVSRGEQERSKRNVQGF